jgi:hypothetical protein
VFKGKKHTRLRDARLRSQIPLLRIHNAESACIRAILQGCLSQPLPKTVAELSSHNLSIPRLSRSTCHCLVPQIFSLVMTKVASFSRYHRSDKKRKNSVSIIYWWRSNIQSEGSACCIRPCNSNGVGARRLLPVQEDRPGTTRLRSVAFLQTQVGRFSQHVAPVLILL